jgi:hypothetical protein
VHFIEALKFETAKLVRLLDGLLAERGEFRGDVAVYSVKVDAKLTGDFPVRRSRLPQVECIEAALGDAFELAAASPRSPLRACGVAPFPATVRPWRNGAVGKASSRHGYLSSRQAAGV